MRHAIKLVGGSKFLMIESFDNPPECPICLNPVQPAEKVQSFLCDNNHLIHSDCGWKWVKPKLLDDKYFLQKKGSWLCPYHCPIPSSSHQIIKLIGLNVPENERKQYLNIIHQAYSRPHLDLSILRMHVQTALTVTISVLFRTTVIATYLAIFTCAKVITLANTLLMRLSGLNRNTLVAIEANLLLVLLCLKMI